jgi:hypothetical protein
VTGLLALTISIGQIQRRFAKSKRAGGAVPSSSALNARLLNFGCAKSLINLLLPID